MKQFLITLLLLIAGMPVRMSALSEQAQTLLQRQKDLSRKLDIVNKSGARIAKALQYGLIDARDIKFLKR